MQRRKPVLGLDTSAINALADDADAGALTAGIRAGFVVRFTGTNIEEIVATPDAARRNGLLDVCRRLLFAGDCIQPFHIIIEWLVKQFDKGTPFEWTQVDVQARDYEDEVIRREIINDAVAQEQRAFARELGRAFADMFGSARPKFEEIFSNGTSRPASFAELVATLQRPGGAFWTGYGTAYYERPAGHQTDEETVRKFTEVCPPFRGLILAVCMAQYERCIREPNVGSSYRAGRSDLLMSVYLPYCDRFVTNECRQERCLREIAGVGDFSTEVLSYATFRSMLMAEGIT